MSRFVDALEDRRLFDGGNLVGNFRSQGSNQPVSTVNFKGSAGQTVVAQEVLADSGGRVYVVGRVGDSLQIRRTTRTGLADGSFANGRGLAIFPADAKLFAFNNPGGTDVALDSADRLYVLVGNRITRFTASGKLDTTFGNRGNATLTGMAGARQIAVDRFNRVYVAGSVFKANGDTQFAVARLISRGRYDATFDVGGILVVPPSNESTEPTQGRFIRVLDAGSVMAAGSVGHYAADGVNILSDQNLGYQSLRIGANGDLDGLYAPRGQNGISSNTTAATGTIQNFFTPLAIRPDGQIYARSLSYNSATNTFSNGGIRVVAINGRSINESTIRRTASPSDNSFQLNSRSFISDAFGREYVQGNDNQLIRLTRDGTLDDTFASDSNAPYIFPVFTAAADSSDGTLVAAYKSSRALSLNVGRYFASDRPIGQLSVKPETRPATSVPFSVTYAADDGLKPELVDGNEIRVISPAGDKIIKARLIDKTINADGTIVGRYRVADSNGWSTDDNGNWAVRFIGGTVTSTNIVSNDVRTLGFITIAIT